MKFREHRGLLEDSLKTEVEIGPTLAALRAHLVETYQTMPNLAAAAQVGVIQVGPDDMEDDRTDWEATYLVTLDGRAVGYCNQLAFEDGLRPYTAGGPCLKIHDERMWAVRNAQGAMVVASFISAEHAQHIATLMNRNKA